MICWDSGVVMAQASTHSPRPGAPNGGGVPSPGTPGHGALPDNSHPTGEPLDLEQQIDALLKEIETTVNEVDPWGDAAQRSADTPQAETVIEPSQKLQALSNAGELAMPPEAPDAASNAIELPTEEQIAVETAEQPALPEQAESSPDAERAFLQASSELSTNISDTDQTACIADPSTSDAAPELPNKQPGTADRSLAAELDSALKDATAALDQIAPPEDPPTSEEAVRAAALETVPTDPVSTPQSEHGAAPAVAEALEHEPAPTTDPDTSAGTALIDAENLADLDAALAEQAEAIAHESLHTPEPEVADAATEHSAVDANSGPLMPEPHTTHGTATAVAAVAASVAPSQASSAPARKSDAPVTLVAPAPKPAAAWPKISAQIKVYGLKAANLLGQPMALLPASARDAVGYLSAVTLFNAAAVWVYILFLYSPPAPPPGEHGGPALHASEPPAHVADGNHGGGHGDAATSAHASPDHSTNTQHATDDSDPHAKPSGGTPKDDGGTRADASVHPTTASAHPAEPAHPSEHAPAPH